MAPRISSTTATASWECAKACTHFTWNGAWAISWSARRISRRKSAVCRRSSSSRWPIRGMPSRRTPRIRSCWNRGKKHNAYSLTKQERKYVASQSYHQHRMMRMHEHGLQDRENSRLYTKEPKCAGAGGHFVTASLVDTAPAMLVLLWGFGFALFLLVAELALKRFNMRKIRKKEQHHQHVPFMNWNL